MELTRLLGVLALSEVAQATKARCQLFIARIPVMLIAHHIAKGQTSRV